MGEELARFQNNATMLKKILLENNNIDILLYLAKYNPKVSRRHIEEKIGKDSLKGLEELKKCNLVVEDNKSVSLTQEGIFQVDGLLTLIA
ncbi:MAG: hypothetical protein AABX01_08130 [Candidatus Micrarchaeota archaeon]